MRRAEVGRVLAAVALALVVARPAFAQDKAIVVAGGWAPLFLSDEGGSTGAPLGLMFNVAASITRSVQIVGDLSYAYKSESGLSAHFLTTAGGVRYLIPTSNAGNVSPFVEGLLGVGYISASFEGMSGSQSGLTAGVGGGIDMRASERLNLRFQVDYFLNRASGVNINEIRVGIGLSSATKYR